jgi:hypothetical protein
MPGVEAPIITILDTHSAVAVEAPLLITLQPSRFADKPCFLLTE